MDLPTAIDARRINRLVHRAVALEILRKGSKDLRALDLDLMPVDRIMQRWAVSIGAGLPADKWDDSNQSRPTPLDPDTAIIVDQTILRAPERRHRLLRTWYKTPSPSMVIADSLGLSVGGLYLEWRAALHYLQIRFRDSRHADLLRILTVTL